MHSPDFENPSCLVDLPRSLSSLAREIAPPHSTKNELTLIAGRVSKRD